MARMNTLIHASTVATMRTRASDRAGVRHRAGGAGPRPPAPRGRGVAGDHPAGRRPVPADVRPGPGPGAPPRRRGGGLRLRMGRPAWTCRGSWRAAHAEPGVRGGTETRFHLTTARDIGLYRLDFARSQFTGISSRIP